MVILEYSHHTHAEAGNATCFCRFTPGGQDQFLKWDGTVLPQRPD